jgi:MerR family copper efflux transcriptional regulator
MRIGELAARTGLATSAIRYYEAQGVLSAPTRGTNGYRCYAEDDIERLRIIRKSQNLGFTLDVIRGLFAKDGVCLYDDHTLATVDARLREIEALQASLAEQNQELLTLKARLGSALHERDKAG